MGFKYKKPLFLVIGLLVFAALGAGVISYSGLNSRPKPVLSAGYKFSKGISPAKLGLSNGEIVSLNRSFWKHREVLKKAELTVIGQESERGPKEMTPEVGLKFHIQFQGKSGMFYSPENILCKRKYLISEIRRYVSDGARILIAYEKNPDLVNREVEIIDM